MASDDSLSTTVAVVQRLVKRVLGGDVAPSEPLVGAGLDSLGSIELRDIISTEFRVELPSTLIFDHPTVDAIAQFVVSKSGEPGGAPGGQVDNQVTRTMGTVRSTPGLGNRTVCIVAVQASYPRARGFDDVVVGEADVQRAVPLGRWDVEESYSMDGMYARFGAFFDDVTLFDASAFKMSDAQGACIDPQQRMLLEGAFDVLHQAPAVMAADGVAVAVGCMNFEFSQVLSASGDEISSTSATGTSANFMAGRLSYHYGLSGASLAIDTACSSSLVGAHIGRTAILRRDSSASLACGVNLMLSPVTMMAVCKLMALSPEGRCKTFDVAANGYGRSEACVVMALAAADDAPNAAESVVMVSSAINQDGRSTSLTAPSGPSQTRLVRSAMRTDEVDASGIVASSFHGTGTPLGDPIEMNALVNALGTRVSGPTIQAFKSAGGHGEGAAGLSGLASALRVTSQHSATCIKHLISLNPYVEQILAQTGKTQHIPRGSAGLGGGNTSHGLAQTSSFGMSGTNATAIVGGSPPISPFGAKCGHLQQTSLWPTVIHRRVSRARAGPGRVLVHLADSAWEVADRPSPAIYVAFMMDISTYFTTGRACRPIVGDTSIPAARGRRGRDLAAAVSLADGSVRVECDGGTTVCRGTIMTAITCLASAGETSKRSPLGGLVAATAGPLAALRGAEFASAKEGWTASIDLALHIRSESAEAPIQTALSLEYLAFGQGLPILFVSATVSAAGTDRPGHGFLTAGCGRVAGFGITVGLLNGVQADEGHQSYIEAWIPRPALTTQADLPGAPCAILDIGASKGFPVTMPRGPVSIRLYEWGDALEAQASSVVQVACMLLHSEISRLVVVDRPSSKADVDLQVLIDLYEVMCLVSWNKTVSISPLIVSSAGERPPSVAVASVLRALSRTLFVERRELFAPTLHVVGEYPVISLGSFESMMQETGEYALQLDGTRRYVRRLIRQTPRRGALLASQRTSAPDTVAVNGGTKGLGYEYVKWATRLPTARYAAVTSSRGYLHRGTIGKLLTRGCCVSVTMSDSRHPEDAREFLETLRETYPYVDEHVYAAGISLNAPIGALDSAEHRNVLATKLGSLADQSLAKRELYLSSIASVWSQTSGFYYCAANAALDMHAAMRHDAGLQCISLQLGPFADSGLAKDLTSEFQQLGVRPFAAMEIVSIRLAAVAPLSAHVDFDAPRLATAFSLRGPWKLLELISGSEVTAQTVGCEEEAAGASRPTTVPMSGVTTTFRDIRVLVTSTLHEVLGDHDTERDGGSSDADGDVEIDFASIDSLTAVDVARTLSAQLDVDIDATLIYDYPSVSSMAGRIADMMGVHEARAGSSADSHPAAEVRIASPHQMLLTLPPPGGHARPIRIVQTTDLPGAAPSIQDSSGTGRDLSRDRVSLVPSDRWDVDDPTRSLSARFGGWLGGIQLFDSSLFGISAMEAICMDPQQRRLLESALRIVSVHSAGRPGGWRLCRHPAHGIQGAASQPHRAVELLYEHQQQF